MVKVEEVKGYPGYLIYSDGRLMGKKGKFKRIKVRGKYIMTSLSRGGVTTKISMHRLVALHFVGGHTHEKNYVNHIDGNKLNNDYRNLEWVTAQGNTDHAIRMGLHKDNSGPNNNTSKLSERDFQDILQLKSQGVTYQVIADRYKMSRGHIVKLVNGRTWKSRHKQP